MKVTAFIRETSAKNNITDQAHVYFRVRDGKTDIKAVSELSINPNHWSAERQGYKTRVALVAEAKRTAFDKAVQDLTALISARIQSCVSMPAVCREPPNGKGIYKAS